MQIAIAFSRLLNPAQRRRYIALQIYFLIAAVVQVAVVASIAPFIGILAQPELIRTNRLLAWMYSAGGFQSDSAFLIFFACLLILVIVVGNAIPAFMGFLSWQFVRTVAVDLQSDVYRGFMYGDLAKRAHLNSPQMISMVTQGVNRLIHHIVLPLLSFVSSGFAIGLIAVGLLFYDPVVALVAVIVVGGGYVGIFLLSKRRLAAYGRISWDSLEAKQRILSESLGGIREIRLAGTIPAYESKLHSITDSALRAEAKANLFGDLPRFALEGIAFSALLALGIFLILRGDPWASIVAILSVYAMAGYRILPSAQAVFRAASMMRANMDVVDEILDDIKAGRDVLDFPTRTDVRYSREAPLVFNQVSFAYPGESRNVLENINVQFERGSITALVGRSGAGKSTFADLALGLISPTAGKILVGDIDIQSSLTAWQRSVSLVSQNVFLLDDTVERNIVFGTGGEVDENRLTQAAEMAHAAGFINALPQQYQCRAGENGSRFSGGQRQRIGIARALYNDAELIVLDEPTSALDSVAERDVIGAIGSLRGLKTVILITHKLQSLKSADNIIVLDHGRVVSSGTFASLSETCDLFGSLLSEY
jgi:ABC-type multidrug transport system fused ATPase/permease subunit